MIERAEKENRIGAGLSLRKMTRVADFGGSEGVRRLLLRRSTRLIHVLGHRIDQVHFISAGSQPARVSSGAAAGVNYGGGSGRQVAENQFPGARLLELKPSLAEPGGFVGVVVVTEHPVRGHVVAHLKT